MTEQGTPPRVCAAADVGSNATKVLVWEIGAGRQFRERFQKRFPLRLDDVFRTGQLEPPTVARLAETLAELAGLARGHGANGVKAVATEAFRLARNGRLVAQTLAHETGVELEVIAAARETELLAKAVLLDHPARAGSLVILDVGGGSAQIGVAGLAGRLAQASLPLGAVRLREMFVHGDPMSAGDFQALREHVELTVALGVRAIRPESAAGVGCGGGVRFLHAMSAIQSGRVGQDDPIRFDLLEHLLEAIWHMPVESLLRHYGLDRERAEIIVPGAVVLHTLMKHLKLSALRVSKRGVRDGLLAECLG